MTLVFAVACGPSGEPDPDQKTGSADERFTEVVTESSLEAAAIHQQTIDIIKVASGDFTLDLTKQPAPESAIEPVTDRLIELADRQNRALAETYGLIELLDDSERQTNQELGRTRQPLLFTATITLGGVFLAGYVAKTQIDGAIDKRTAPTRKKLSEATEAELEIARKEMGLSSDADREAILKAFDGADSSKKLTYSKNIEAALEVAVANNKPDVDNVDPTELRQAISKSAVDLGETAVNTTVSVATTATGGQGMTQALQATGMSERAAQVVDLTVSAVSVATGEPLQPLDRFGASMTVTAVSEQKKSVEVPRPEVDMSVEEAVEILNDAGTSGGLGAAAAAKIFRDGADKVGAVTDEKPDGSVTVEVPARVHRTTVEDVLNETTLSFPDFDLMDIVVTAVDHAPKLFDDIDLSETSNLEFPVADADDEDPDGDDDRNKTCIEYAKVCAPPADYCEEKTLEIQQKGCVAEWEGYLDCLMDNDCDKFQCSHSLQTYFGCIQ